MVKLIAMLLMVAVVFSALVYGWVLITYAPAKPFTIFEKCGLVVGIVFSAYLYTVLAGLVRYGPALRYSFISFLVVTVLIAWNPVILHLIGRGAIKEMPTVIWAEMLLRFLVPFLTACLLLLNRYCQPHQDPLGSR